MNYVKGFNLLGKEVQQIPHITGNGVPNSATEGAVGCLYMNVLTGDTYKCISVVDNEHTWEIQVGEQYLTQALNELKEELQPMEIVSFSAYPNRVEIGTEITEVTLNWTLNKQAQSLKLDDEDIGILTSGSEKLTGLTLKSNKIWTLSASDSKGSNVTRNASLSFLKGIYYGVVNQDTTTITNSLILGLTKTLQPSTNIEQSFVVTPTTDQRVVFALPTDDYNDPIFKIGGFEYTWEKVEEFNFTNLSGHTESYTVWRSVQAVADTLSITATATKK